MPALAATDVTVTVNIRDRTTFTKKHRIAVTIAFGDGALTYPAAGVPMPAFDKFGMKRNLETIEITDPANADGFMYKYDQANNKLRIWQGDNPNAAAAPAVELGAVAVTAKTLKGYAFGW